MSSKRGRKRNDNLPPNRARDVQRAFRQRRSEHLKAMEERVAELEEENDRLRAALNMPPANRMPLGKGPTGKDKPKPYKVRSQDASTSSAVPLPLPPGTAAPQGVNVLSRATSADSGVSTRATSISPTSHSSLQTSPQALEAGQWRDIMGGPSGSSVSDESNGDSSTATATPGSFSQPSSVPPSFPGSSTGTPTYGQSPVSPSFNQNSAPSTPFGAPSVGPFSLSGSTAQKAPSPWVQLPATRSSLAAGPVFLPPNYTPGADAPGMASYPRSYLDPTSAYTSSPISPTSHDPGALHGGAAPHPASLQALVHPSTTAGSAMPPNLPFGSAGGRRPLDSAHFRSLPNHLFMSSQPHPASLAHIRVSPPPRAPDDTASAARNG